MATQSGQNQEINEKLFEELSLEDLPEEERETHPRDVRRVLQDCLVACGLPECQIPTEWPEIKDTTLMSNLVSNLASRIPDYLPEATLSPRHPDLNSLSICGEKPPKTFHLTGQKFLKDFAKSRPGRVSVNYRHVDEFKNEFKLISETGEALLTSYSNRKMVLSPEYVFRSSFLSKKNYSAYYSKQPAPVPFLAAAQQLMFRFHRDTPRDPLSRLNPSFESFGTHKELMVRLDRKTPNGSVKDNYSILERYQMILALRRMRIKKDSEYSTYSSLARSVEDIPAFAHGIVHLCYLTQHVGAFDVVLSKNNRLKYVHPTTLPLSADYQSEPHQRILVYDLSDYEDSLASLPKEFDVTGLDEVHVQSLSNVLVSLNNPNSVVQVNLIPNSPTCDNLEKSHKKFLDIITTFELEATITDIIPGPETHNGVFFIVRDSAVKPKLTARKFKNYVYNTLFQSQVAGVIRYFYELTGYNFPLIPRIPITAALQGQLYFPDATALDASVPGGVPNTHFHLVGHDSSTDEESQGVISTPDPQDVEIMKLAFNAVVDDEGEVQLGPDLGLASPALADFNKVLVIEGEEEDSDVADTEAFKSLVQRLSDKTSESGDETESEWSSSPKSFQEITNPDTSPDDDIWGDLQ